MTPIDKQLHLKLGKRPVLITFTGDVPLYSRAGFSHVSFGPRALSRIFSVQNTLWPDKNNAADYSACSLCPLLCLCRQQYFNNLGDTQITSQKLQVHELSAILHLLNTRQSRHLRDPPASRDLRI